MKNMEMDEKRLYKRLGIKGKVLLKTNGNKARLVKASIDNLSFGGFHMRASKPLNLDDNAEFTLVTKFLGKPLAGKCRIRHVKNSRGLRLAGVQFVNTNLDNLRDLIKTILRKRHKAFFYREKFIKDLSIALKIAPFAIIVSLVAMISLNTMIYDRRAENNYNKRYVVYYVYSDSY